MRCRVCGCTADEPCVDDDLEVACGWAAANLCTFCEAEIETGVIRDDARFSNLERAGFVLP